MIIFLSGYIAGHALGKMERSEKRRPFVYIASLLIGLLLLLGFGLYFYGIIYGMDALLRFFRSVF